MEGFHKTLLNIKEPLFYEFGGISAKASSARAFRKIAYGCFSSLCSLRRTPRSFCRGKTGGLNHNLKSRKKPSKYSTLFVAGLVSRNWNTIKPSLSNMHSKLKGLELLFPATSFNNIGISEHISES